MADLADEAQATEEAERDTLRARIVARLPAGPGLAQCAVCGEAIEPARRAALPGVRWCRDCAAEAERVARLHGQRRLAG